MPDEVTRKVIAVIAETMHVPADTIQPESSFADLGIDSLDGINIVFGLEKEFGISVADDAARELRSVADVVDGIRSLLEAKRTA